MAGSSTDSPRFFYDLASPEAYVAAERVVDVLGVVPEFVPVRVAGLAAGGVGGWRCAEEEAIFRSEVERRADAAGLMPLRWPPVVPAEAEWAMLVATYAKQVGRVVAFSLAAFRQAFAAGRDLGERDTVLIAAAAAEMHPAAVAKGAALRSTRERLDAATAAAAEAGVLDVPAVAAGGRVFHGDRELEAAAAVLARVVPAGSPVVNPVDAPSSPARTQGGCNGGAIAPTEDAAGGGGAPPERERTRGGDHK